MTQKHPYDPHLAYHFINMALASEAQPMWEVDDGKNPDLEDLFAIPRQYYEALFAASRTPIDAIYDDIHQYVKGHYEAVGVIRIGAEIVPDYLETDVNWELSEVDSFERVVTIMNSYSRRVTETITNTVRYSFSRLLMGYALRAKDGSHGVIVMRGTMTVDEWLNNMNYRLIPFHPLDEQYGKVHNGFRDVYKGIRGRYRQLVQEFAPDKPLYLVGHSLGAVVSQLAALDLALKNPERADQIQVYAFAPPRIGDPTFAKVYDQAVATSYRIVNVCDVVPYIPFEEMDTLVDVRAYPYADTKGELAYVHQAGNPIANHISSYHIATRLQVPAEIDISQPRSLP
ncbi:MAG: lipase family protein [Anaerolineae bacterium]